MHSYRSVFISDVHLGTPDCQAEYLLDFLNTVSCQTLYLVGDIVDLIAMQRRACFPPSHQAVIHKLFDLAALTAAEKGHYDGFICGHIHSAGFLRSDDGLYCNDGDWVEHCTALVESNDGRLSLLHWSERPEIQAVEPEAPAPDVCPDQRPVIDVLPAAFIEQVNRLAQ